MSVPFLGARHVYSALDPGNALALAVLYVAVVLTVASGALYFSDVVRGRGGVEWR